MTQTETEIQGPFTRNFSGLNTSNAVGSVPVDASPVFHNCDISNNGAVVRRKGTAVVTQIDLNSTDNNCWSESIRTKLGSEYLVVANSTGFLVSLMRDDIALAMPQVVASVVKGNVWTVPPSSMQFIAVNAPYDRLLIITPEHPIVQLSFLERTLSFNCTTNNGGGNFTFTSPISVNDTTLWRDNVATNYIVTDTTGAVIPITLKTSGFNFRANGTFTVGQNYTFTIRQITWQWWAESIYYEGADLMQSTSRFNVTAVDQNVKVPDRLITDLDPIYKNSPNIGLYAFSSSRFDTNVYVGPRVNPDTDLQYGFSNGGLFNRPSNVPGTELTTAPFFVTFGTTITGSPPPINQVSLLRLRELRFNGNTGAKPNDLRVYVDTIQYPWNSAGTVAAGLFLTYAESFTATDRVLTVNTSLADGNINQRYWGIQPPTASIPYNAPVHITSLAARTYYGSANTTFYRDLPTAGGPLDGTYVRAYGIGKFVDYSKRNFHAIATLYRDRLVLVNPSTAQDQLIISESGDSTVPGEYYQFFQVTDMLSGAVTDPFTVNVTNEARETITAMTSWQGSLFIFTNSNTYSVSGGEQFGESSFAVNLVSTYGAFNQRCIVITNLTVLYLNRFGLFDLTNKPNSDNYGAFERTVNIRDQFENLAGSSGDLLHWLHYNEATNKLYMGLATASDTRRTSRNLMLNVTWNAWATLGSVIPFRLYPCTQVFKYTLMLASVSAPRYVALLCTEMPFYLDFAGTYTDSYPFTVYAPVVSNTYASDSRGIFDLPAVTPGLNDYVVANSTKTAKRFQRNAKTQGNELSTLRNPMLDYANTLELLGGNTNASVFGMALPNGYEPFTVYPTMTFNATPPLQWTVTQAFGTVNKPCTSQGQVVVGMLYPSVYASPVFDLDTLGRLKRLRRLHLHMDTTIVGDLSYTLLPSLNRVKVLNTAFVSVISNYNENTVPSVIQYTTDDQYEMRQSVQLTLPLQGYGCDYQFYVTSVGAEAFKLAAYEIEVQPQRDKRYVRR